jgi:hypothetical protein
MPELSFIAFSLFYWGLLLLCIIRWLGLRHHHIQLINEEDDEVTASGHSEDGYDMDVDLTISADDAAPGARLPVA